MPGARSGDHSTLGFFFPFARTSEPAGAAKQERREPWSKETVKERLLRLLKGGLPYLLISGRAYSTGKRPSKLAYTGNIGVVGKSAHATTPLSGAARKIEEENRRKGKKKRLVRPSILAFDASLLTFFSAEDEPRIPISKNLSSVCSVRLLLAFLHSKPEVAFS